MKLSQFKFDLPLNLIAQNPTKRREDSRMMVVDQNNQQKQIKLSKVTLMRSNKQIWVFVLTSSSFPWTWKPEQKSKSSCCVN